MTRLLVTGPRDWGAYGLVRKTLSRFHGEYPDAILISGHAPGADTLCEHAWAHLCGYPTAVEAAAAGRIEVYRAQWDLYGKAAGMKRNKVMVDTKPDWFIAFRAYCCRDNCPASGVHLTHGTAGCIKLAEDAGIAEYRLTSYPW